MNRIKLKAFSQFKDTVEAVAAATAMVEGSLGKGLKKFLQKQLVKKESNESLVSWRRMFSLRPCVSTLLRSSFIRDTVSDG